MGEEVWEVWEEMVMCKMIIRRMKKWIDKRYVLWQDKPGIFVKDFKRDMKRLLSVLFSALLGVNFAFQCLLSILQQCKEVENY